jgi:RNA-directed DNA polymerase
MQRLYKKLLDELEQEGHYLSRASVESFAATAPNRYKVYTIPKRTSGHRVIAHPSKELKVYQRALVAILEGQLISHHSSYAYKKGVSIKDNALKHVKNRYLLKMDFNEFFNSITPEIFFQSVSESSIQFSKSEQKLIENLFFWNKPKTSERHLVLSVGAPSSPIVSNFVMFSFDTVLEAYCHEKSIAYTRYADDLTFSTNIKNILFSMPSFVKETLGHIYQHRITVNNSKTVFSSKAHNRHVTGVTITNENNISIGREKKRTISVMVHKNSIGKLDEPDFKYLQGLLSFAHHIEPRFIISLKSKYGCSLVDNIIKGKV